MIYFDSDMSKSTNTVVYFDWKTVIHIYVCEKCRTQFMLPGVRLPPSCMLQSHPCEDEDGFGDDLPEADQGQTIGS
jgi:hypothetical protein